MPSNTILLTGATGFLGRALIKELEGSNLGVRPVVRSINDDSPKGAVAVGAIDGCTTYTEALVGVYTVIHAAARAHIMKDEADDPLSEYRKVNVCGSENLARQAIASGVKRFVFISSIKVCGESTTGSKPYDENIDPAPRDFYAQSKLEAELLLKKVVAGSDMELVIIRPPLIYGPDVKANFLNLLRLCDSPFPLPFGLVNNRRSIVYLGNLVDFIIRCCEHPSAANRTLLVADAQDVSLASLISMIRSSMGRRAYLLPIPVSLFILLGRITDKMMVVDRLVGDLRLNNAQTRQLIDWTPPYTSNEGLAETVASFISAKSRE